MNDLPQNELLSAYLDGELTAAEQADVERLLATDPAARQLLDELRTLSATLQALPQQKVGEDLTDRVLRVAERRMLTGEESGPAEPSPWAPVPLVRSVFRRVANRRTLVWLGLTLSVAMMIRLSELRQNKEKEVALAPAMSDSAPKEPGPLPSMTARHDQSPIAAKELKSPEEQRLRESRDAPVDLAKDKESESAAEKQSVAPPQSFAPAAEPMDGSAAIKFGGKPTPDDNIAPAEPLPMARTNDATPAAPGRAGASYKMSGGGAGADRRLTEQGGRAAAAAEGPLVVQCNISAEAAQQQAFSKLLNANGITWSQKRDGTWQVDDAARSLKAKDADQKEMTTSDEANRSYGFVRSLQLTAEAGDGDLIYAEGTAAQIGATLAGLKAQPEMFPSVSIEPAQTMVTPRIVVAEEEEEKLEATPQQLRSGEPQGKSALGGGVFGAASAKKRLDTPASGEKLERQEKNQVGAGAAQRSASQSQAQSPPRLQVLFVLRVVGGQQTPAAAKVRPADQSAPAKPAAPAAAPADRLTPNQ